MPLQDQQKRSGMFDGVQLTQEVPLTTGLTQTNLVNVESISKSKSVPNKREPRRKSPTNFNWDGIGEAPVSPSPSSAADITFEPTIDMMVNDFDDEQTLNEEEALADLEAQNPEDEIATLKQESEMPIEELLAMYGAMESMEPTPRRKQRKHTSAKRKKDKTATVVLDTINVDEAHEMQNFQQDLSCTENDACNNKTSITTNNLDEVVTPQEDNEQLYKDMDEDEEFVMPTDAKKAKRSHLLDLYPEENFEADSTMPEHATNFAPLDLLYEDAEDEEEEEEDAETESDYVRKTIMVGNAYQADIPDGLSQYGDILPYENEDKLIWEPSQVTERDVEEYLIKAHDIKVAAAEASTESALANDVNETCTNDVSKCTENEIDTVKENCKAETETGGESPAIVTDTEQVSVVKDNEQALHLLVQCGYDFKEALRRKRLNVLPLTDKMSSWSEEECAKFEEGIQKYGKDFYKIRQNLVRTRTMREMVQFYYLWKKSERRDHKFANADTVDHMDIYLNESEDFGTSILQNGNGGPHGATVVIATSAANARKSAAKNFSIMTGNSTISSEHGVHKTNAATAAVSGATTTTTTTQNTTNNNVSGGITVTQAYCPHSN